MTDYATDECTRPIKMSLFCQIEMTLPRIFREVPGVTVRLMSDKELARLEVLRDLDQRGLTPVAAAQLLGLEQRQVFRLLKAYRAEGAAGLVSQRRGRPSNRRQPAELRATALAIIRERYWDFGPTLAAHCPASTPVRQRRPVEEERVNGSSSPVKERRWDNNPSG